MRFEKTEGVGATVMKDKEIKLEETEVSHTRWSRGSSCPESKVERM